MKTSKEWWEEVKADDGKFVDWLQRQYRGEVTAANRIRNVAEMTDDEKERRVLEIIASQEETHAEWVKELLENRGITPHADTENAEKRYWAAVKESITDFKTAMAVGAHAEAMRLERIKTICEDAFAPYDVQKVFMKILLDETFHERAFRGLAGEEAMNATEANHEEGKRLLGLEA